MNQQKNTSTFLRCKCAVHNLRFNALNAKVKNEFGCLYGRLLCVNVNVFFVNDIRSAP